MNRRPLRLVRRPEPRNCFDCWSYDLRDGSGWCVKHHEPIDSETHAASDCPDYDPLNTHTEGAR